MASNSRLPNGFRPTIKINVHPDIGHIFTMERCEQLAVSIMERWSTLPAIADKDAYRLAVMFGIKSHDENHMQGIDCKFLFLDNLIHSERRKTIKAVLYVYKLP